MRYKVHTFSIIGMIALAGALLYLAYGEPEDIFGDTSSTNGAQNAVGNGTCGNDNWSLAIGAITNLQTNDTNYAIQNTNRWDQNDVSDQLNALDFGFTTIAGTIDGIEVRAFGWSTTGDANTYTTVQLTTDSGTTIEGTNQATGAMSTSDDDVYGTFGSASDNWGGVITAAEANTTAFGAIFCWTSVANNTEANIDHVEMTITFTPSTARQRAVIISKGDSKYIGNGQFQQVRYGTIAGL